MKIEDYLLDKMKRLNRQNDILEKKMNQGMDYNNEPEQIVCNVKAMCDIASILI